MGQGAGGLAALPFSLDAEAGEEVLTECMMAVGKSKADASPVTIFKAKPGNEASLAVMTNALQRMKTLRHPHCLRFENGVQVETEVFIVTERVTTLLKAATEAGAAGLSTSKLSAWFLWGIYTVCDALSLLHDSCQQCHGFITPQSIFVNKQRDWKLGGFGLTVAFRDSGPARHFVDYVSLLPEAYASPEVKARDWDAISAAPIHAMDSWALAKSVEEAWAAATSAAMPSALSKLTRKLAMRSPRGRTSPSRLIASSLKDHSFVAAMLRVEGLAVMEDSDKPAFYKALMDSLPHFPPIADKLLSHLVQSIEFGAQPAVLPLLLRVGSELDEDAYKSNILPSIVKLFSSTERAVRAALLRHAGDYVRFMDSTLVNKTIFPAVAQGFVDKDRAMKQISIMAVPHFVPLLSESNLNAKLMAHFKKLLTDPNDTVRSNALVCLSRLPGKLKQATVEGAYVTLLLRSLRDPLPSARDVAVKALNIGLRYLPCKMLAAKLLPALSPLLMDASSSVRASALLASRNILSKLEEESERMKAAAEAAAAAKKAAGGADSDPASAVEESKSKPVRPTAVKPSSVRRTPAAAAATAAATATATATVPKPRASLSLGFDEHDGSAGGGGGDADDADDGWGDDGWGDDDDLDDLDDLDLSPVKGTVKQPLSAAVSSSRAASALPAAGLSLSSATKAKPAAMTLSHTPAAAAASLSTASDGWGWDADGDDVDVADDDFDSFDSMPKRAAAASAAAPASTRRASGRAAGGAGAGGAAAAAPRRAKAKKKAKPVVKKLSMDAFDDDGWDDF